METGAVLTAPRPCTSIRLPVDAVVLARSLDEVDANAHSARAKVYANARTKVAAWLGKGGHNTDTVVAASELCLWLTDMQAREARQIR